MRICRVRRFKNSYEVTVAFQAKESEALSHIISYSADQLAKPLAKDVCFIELKRQGQRILTELDNKVFWAHWDSNFMANSFQPRPEEKK